MKLLFFTYYVNTFLAEAAHLEDLYITNYLYFSFVTHFALAARIGNTA